MAPQKVVAFSPAEKGARAIGIPAAAPDSPPAITDAPGSEWPLKPAKVPHWNRATLRFCLGQAQMWGAIATLLLLFQGASTDYVLAGAAITGLFSLTSLVLFRVVWKD